MTTDNSLILGIDTSTKMPAYCLMNITGAVVDCGKITLEPLTAWFEKMKDAGTVAIEGQYVGLNKHAALKLSFCSGQLVAVAKLAGKNPIIVSPKQWQPNMLKISIRQPREVIKRLSKAYAGVILGEKVKDDDIADAVMIAEFARQKVVGKKHNGAYKANTRRSTTQRQAGATPA